MIAHGVEVKKRGLVSAEKACEGGRTMHVLAHKGVESDLRKSCVELLVQDCSLLLVNLVNNAKSVLLEANTEQTKSVTSWFVHFCSSDGLAQEVNAHTVIIRIESKSQNFRLKIVKLLGNVHTTKTLESVSDVLGLNARTSERFAFGDGFVVALLEVRHTKAVTVCFVSSSLFSVLGVVKENRALVIFNVGSSNPL